MKRPSPPSRTGSRRPWPRTGWRRWWNRCSILPPLPSRADIEALTADLPRLWAAETTSNKNRKRLLRTLIAGITLLPETDPTMAQSLISRAAPHQETSPPTQAAPLYVRDTRSGSLSVVRGTRGHHISGV